MSKLLATAALCLLLATPASAAKEKNFDELIGEATRAVFFCTHSSGALTLQGAEECHRWRLWLVRLKHQYKLGTGRSWEDRPEWEKNYVK